MSFFSKSATLILLASLGSTVNALPMFSVGSTVTSADRSATFDSLNSNGIDLSTYSEDSLFVTVDDISFQGDNLFSDGARLTSYHYADGGNNSYVSIRGTDNVKFSALDFLIGNGAGVSIIDIRWETFRDGVSTSMGIKTATSTNGQTVGWSDSEGFDELRVAAGPGSPGFGTAQSIALDDLRAQITAVPLPAAFWLMGSALVGIFSLKRRKAV